MGGVRGGGALIDPHELTGPLIHSVLRKPLTSWESMLTCVGGGCWRAIIRHSQDKIHLSSALLRGNKLKIGTFHLHQVFINCLALTAHYHPWASA